MMAIFMTVIFAQCFQNELNMDELTRAKKFLTILDVRAQYEGRRHDNRKICERMAEIISKDNNSEKKTHIYGSPKQLALFVIGYHVDYRTDSVIIKTLIDNVHIRFPPFSESRIPSLDETYPALRGLLLIGERATLPILEKIKSTDDHSVHNPLAYWFNKHYGRKMALHYLGSLIDENPNMPTDQRQRIVYVMGQISKYKSKGK